MVKLLRKFTNNNFLNKYSCIIIQMKLMKEH